MNDTAAHDLFKAANPIHGMLMFLFRIMMTVLNPALFGRMAAQVLAMKLGAPHA